MDKYKALTAPMGQGHLAFAAPLGWLGARLALLDADDQYVY